MQAALLATSLERLEEALGGARFEGTAVDEGGAVRNGTFVVMGPVIDRIYTADVFMHRWDLARATGQDETLDPERCAAMYEGMATDRPAARSSLAACSMAGNAVSAGSSTAITSCSGNVEWVRASERRLSSSDGSWPAQGRMTNTELRASVSASVPRCARNRRSS